MWQRLPPFLTNTANNHPYATVLNQYVGQFQSLETPFYFYDLQLLERTLNALQSANRFHYHVHYALKANNNPRILQVIRKYGLGVDCVSGNEIAWVLENGFEASQIVFAGVGKSDKEIRFAIDANIFSFNVESVQELEVIDELAAAQGKTVNVSIRVNPAIDAGTHKHITTGSKGDKFGISDAELLEALDRFSGFQHLRFIGLHYHIGSQITDLNRFRNLCDRVNELQLQLSARGWTLPHLNVGGGLGINYLEPDEHSIPDFEGYFNTFHEHLKLLPGQELHFELGRAIVGQCGNLISRVLFIKEHQDERFAILDAGMTDLMRPALYQAVHKIENLTSTASNTKVYDIAGPVCESTDFFARKLTLPETKRGDLLVLRSAGAYGETMKNAYNCRDLAQAYYSDDFTK